DFSGQDKAKQHRIHLFGGSWGSALALYYGAHYPERLHSMTIRATTLVNPGDLNKLHAVDEKGVPLLKIEMEKQGQDWNKMAASWDEFVAYAKEKAPQFGTDYIAAYHHILSGTDPKTKKALFPQEVRREAALRWNMIEHLSGDMEHDAAW